MAPHGQTNRQRHTIPATTGFEKDAGRAATLDANARHKGDEHDQVVLVEQIEVVVNERARPGGPRPPRPEDLELIESDYDHPYAHYAVGYSGNARQDRRRLHQSASRRGARPRGRGHED